MKALSIVCCLLAFVLPVKAELIDNGVILVYHHVSEKTPPSTSISPAKFREHLEYLKQHHQVISLTDMVETLRKGKPLPDKAVAITFDDGYLNIYENGHPLLREYGFPYTIFISPPLIGVQSDQLSWEQIRKMQSEGVTFGNHTSEHNHLLARNPQESEQQWLNRAMQDINSAQQLLDSKIDNALKYLAYPYGEYNELLGKTIVEQGYTGFGQHSGPVASHSDFSALPRFASAGIYASLNSLKVKLNSLAMPVKKKAVTDPELSWQKRRPTQVLTLNDSDFNMSQIGCFLNGDPLEVEKKQNQLTLNVPEMLNAGRTRINCTAPSKQYRGRFYWYSQPWFVPDAQGLYHN